MSAGARRTWRGGSLNDHRSRDIRTSAGHFRMPGAGTGGAHHCAACVDTHRRDRLRPAPLRVGAQRPQRAARMGGDDARRDFHPAIVRTLPHLQRPDCRYRAAGADGGLEIVGDQNQARHIHHHVDHLLRQPRSTVGRGLFLAARLPDRRAFAGSPPPHCCDSRAADRHPIGARALATADGYWARLCLWHWFFGCCFRDSPDLYGRSRPMGAVPNPA